MWQVPQSVWNEIWKVADNGKKMHNPLLAKWFAMEPEEIEKVLEDQGRKLENNGHSNSVIIAYQKVAPLLVENKAITKYLEAGNLPPLMDYQSMRDVLPEILDEKEAMQRAALETILDEEDEADLMPMFRKIVPRD